MSDPAERRATEPRERGLLRVAQLLDGLQDAIGWLLVVAAALVVVGEFAAVALRYGWSYSRPWLQESVLAANAVLFLLGAAYALRHDAHVRVDLWSRKWSARAQAWTEVFGFLAFLLPFCVLLLWVGIPYFLRSLQMHEGSGQNGGLPAVYVLKLLIPLFAALLIAAGLARTLRALNLLLRADHSPA